MHTDKNFSLINPTPEHAMLREMLKSFVKSEVEPQAHEFDRKEQFNLALFKKLGGLGLERNRIPDLDGGGGGGSCAKRRSRSPAARFVEDDEADSLETFDMHTLSTNLCSHESLCSEGFSLIFSISSSASVGSLPVGSISAISFFLRF